MGDLYRRTTARQGIAAGDVPRTDAQMVCLESFFPKPHGKPRRDDKRMLFINRNGFFWRDAPATHGLHETL